MANTFSAFNVKSMLCLFGFYLHFTSDLDLFQTRLKKWYDVSKYVKTDLLFSTSTFDRISIAFFLKNAPLLFKLQDEYGINMYMNVCMYI